MTRRLVRAATPRRIGRCDADGTCRVTVGIPGGAFGYPVSTPGSARRARGSRRGPDIHDRVVATTAALLIVTEGHRDLLPGDGHVVDAGNDWGYRIERDRRTVLVYSREPLTDVTRIDSGGGGGRVVTAMTITPSGSHVCGNRFGRPRRTVSSSTTLRQISNALVHGPGRVPRAGCG